MLVGNDGRVAICGVGHRPSDMPRLKCPIWVDLSGVDEAGWGKDIEGIPNDIHRMTLYRIGQWCCITPSADRTIGLNNTELYVGSCAHRVAPTHIDQGTSACCSKVLA